MIEWPKSMIPGCYCKDCKYWDNRDDRENNSGYCTRAINSAPGKFYVDADSDDADVFLVTAPTFGCVDGEKES